MQRRIASHLTIDKQNIMPEFQKVKLHDKIVAENNKEDQMLQRAWSQIKTKKDIHKLNQHRIKDYSPLHIEKASHERVQKLLYSELQNKEKEGDDNGTALTQQQQIRKEFQA